MRNLENVGFETKSLKHTPKHLDRENAEGPCNRLLLGCSRNQPRSTPRHCIENDLFQYLC